MTRTATITTTAPAPAVSDETIARVLSLFERLMDHKTTVDAHLGFDVPVRQLFVLLLAMELPVGPREIRPVARATEGMRFADELYRLRKQPAVYDELRRLFYDGRMTCKRRGRRVFYVPSPKIHNRMQRLLAALSVDGNHPNEVRQSAK